MNREEYASIKINYLRELQKIPFIREAFDFFTLEGIVDTIECNYDNKFYGNKKVLLDSIYQYYFVYFDNYLNNIAIIIKLFDEKDMSSDLSNLYKLYLSYIEIEREKDNEDKIIDYISLEKMIDYKFSKKLDSFSLYNKLSDKYLNMEILGALLNNVNIYQLIIKGSGSYIISIDGYVFNVCLALDYLWENRDKYMDQLNGLIYEYNKLIDGNISELYRYGENVEFCKKMEELNAKYLSHYGFTDANKRNNSLVIRDYK